MGVAWQFARYIVAILIALLVGQIVQVGVAIFINIMAGNEVTGAPWSLNVPNAISFIIQGAAVGSVAGGIARKRGILISAIAVFLPLNPFVLIELIQNGDLSDFIVTGYNTKPVLWTSIALLPALICGHAFSKAAQRHQLLFAATIIYVVCLNVGAAAFHLYTTYVAYYLAGALAAFITFIAPLLSKIYWLIAIWYSTGTVLNNFTMRILACLVVLIFWRGGVGHYRLF